METRFGGMAGVVAIAAALALALAVACSNASGFDYATGTYTFTEPATDYVDENLVLVRDGVVTDVWISESDRTNEYFGYTPPTPASALLAGDDSAVTTVEDETVRQCWFVGTENEHCIVFADIRPVSAGTGSALADWGGLEDGDFHFDSVSVTWDIGSPVRVTVEDGVITAADPANSVLLGLDTASPAAPNGDWVRYWIHGAVEPFAICHDDPRSVDEEECWTWSEVTDARGA